MSKFFIIFFLFTGVLLSIIPNIVMNKIKKGVELESWERNEKFNAASAWLFIYAIIVYITVAGMVIQCHMLQYNEIEKLEQRIEKLETHPQVDTVNILDVLPKE